MRKIIEYTLVSVDGVFAGTDTSGFFEYRDEAYLRDGLGQLLSCDAMLMGRTTYENFARIWPGRSHPWAERINTMPKYVFSSTLEHAEWNNSTIIRGDVVAEVSRLKQQEGRDLLIWAMVFLDRRCSNTACSMPLISRSIRWCWDKGGCSSGRVKLPACGWLRESSSPEALSSSPMSHNPDRYSALRISIEAAQRRPSRTMRW
jgi:RibD C-terminal domain